MKLIVRQVGQIIKDVIAITMCYGLVQIGIYTTYRYLEISGVFANDIYHSNLLAGAANLIALLCCTLLVNKYLRKSHERSNTASYEQKASRWFYLILGTLLISIALSSAVRFLDVDETHRKAVNEFVVLEWGQVFSIVLFAPVIEELFFRKILLDYMTPKYGPLISICLSSLLFGLYHIEPVHVVMATMYGSALGYIYVRTKSIFIVIAAHAINNATSFMKPVFGYNEIDFIVGNSTLIDLLLISGCVMVGVLLVRRHTKSSKLIWGHSNNKISVN